jgi:hypothetical protein
MKILELKGYKSLKALNAFHTLLLGLKMLPAYIQTPYDEFFEGFKEMNEAEKEKKIREAAIFVPLEQNEVEALISFATDKNGIQYSSVNLKNLGAKEIHEIIVAVCMEIGKIEVSLLSEDEKKNFQTSQ